MFDYYKIGILIAFSAICFEIINTKGIDSNCFTANDCGSNNFICYDGKCKCDENHIPDSDYYGCVVDILKPCDYRDTCYDPNAECRDDPIPNGSCRCKNGYTLHKQNLVCNVIMGNKCNVTNDCIEGTCSNNTCLCNSPLEPNVNGSECLPALHDECTKFGKCATENSICNVNTKKCECDQNYKEAKRNETVYCLSMLGNSCKNETHCADIGAECITVNNTETPEVCKIKKYYLGSVEPEVNKTCVCGEKYVENPKVSECLLVTTELEGPCTENIQCTTFSGFGSECVNKKCQCQKGFYFDIDFKICVRSCLCNEMEKDLKEVKSVIKDLRPLIENMARSNNVDVTRLLRKIQKL